MANERSPLQIALTLGVLVAVGSIGTVAALRLQRDRPTLPERWFTPGPLGHEPGQAAPPPGPAAFLTRHIGGLGSPAAAAWARHNGLTPPLSFLHNLASVFPPSLFEKHPEYFPMVDGKR